MTPRAASRPRPARLVFAGASRAVAVVVALLVGGCASSTEVSQTRTAGRSVKIQVWQPKEGRIEFFEVSNQGVFGCSGGVAAQGQQVTWARELTPEEIAKLLDPMSSKAWWTELREAAKGSPDDDELPRTQLWFLGPGAEEEISFHGSLPQVTPIVEAMRSIAMARFDPNLDALPRAGEAFPR